MELQKFFLNESQICVEKDLSSSVSSLSSWRLIVSLKVETNFV